MKMKSSGAGRQTNVVLSPAVSLTRSILRLKSVPGPDSGVIPSFTNAETRKIRIGPEPGKTFPETVHPVAVNPAPTTGGLEKLTTVESKEKSPWKPM